MGSSQHSVLAPVQSRSSRPLPRLFSAEGVSQSHVVILKAPKLIEAAYLMI